MPRIPSCPQQRRAGRLLAASALLAAPLSGAPLSPRVVNPRYATDDLPVALAEIAPPADDDADAAPLIQAAVDRVAEAGGGTLFLAAGHYRLGTPLVIREGVTVRGDWRPPQTGGEPFAGTVLAPVMGRGKPDGEPAITMERGTGLCCVTVWYPEQDAAVPVPYPWTIRFSTVKGGNNMTLRHVTLANPYQGLKIGPDGNELHTLRDVFMTPLKTGLWIDSTTDIGRLTNLDIGSRVWIESGLPGAPTEADAQAALRAAMRAQATGVSIGRSDWEYLYGVQVRDCKVGVLFRQGARGVTNAVMFGSRLENCGTALRLERLNAVGLSATACRFTAAAAALDTPASFDAVAQFNGCEFNSSGAPAVQLAGSGVVTFQRCRFTGWHRCAVHAQAGQLAVVDSAFDQAGTALRADDPVQRVRLLGCRFRGNPEIDNRAAGADVGISHLPLASTEIDLTPHQAAPFPRPASAQLVSVEDFGASADRPDNTAAFQTALDAAAAAGGGTVYVPAGLYRFAGALRVPSDVELRGCFDVPHHTISGGSVLLPTGGRGDADGTPFVRLGEGSGLRGLTFWYPEQNLTDIAPYPWTIRATGPRCWLVDVTLGNAYQGADFWTHPSTGHIIRYLAGGVLKEGLRVSKSDGDGWVEDLQLNPHYAVRLHPDLPRAGSGDPGRWGGALIDYQRRHLSGLVFGRCAREHVRGTFLYAAYDGIAFRDDDGGANARIFLHGTDTGSRAVVAERTGPNGICFVNGQFVSLGKYLVAAMVTTPTFAGRLAFCNSQVWANAPTARLEGSGKVVIQQLNTRSGDIRATGGELALETVNFGKRLPAHVTLGPGCRRAGIIACQSQRGPFHAVNRMTEGCRIFGSSASLPLPASLRKRLRRGQPVSVKLDFEAGAADMSVHLADAGGIRDMAEYRCQVVPPGRPDGRHVLELRGRASGEHSYLYCRFLDGPFTVYPDTVLSYRMKPLNDNGRHCAVDLAFAKGLPLRDRGLRSEDGDGVHPGTGRGRVGEWHTENIPLGGALSGQIIRYLMVAYDHGAGDFAAQFDDVSLVSGFTAKMPQRAELTPPPGRVAVGTTVQVQAKSEGRWRYTLDGSNPTLASPMLEDGVVLRTAGPSEIRLRAELGGLLGDRVFAGIYDVVPEARP